MDNSGRTQSERISRVIYGHFVRICLLCKEAAKSLASLAAASAIATLTPGSRPTALRPALHDAGPKTTKPKPAPTLKLGQHRLRSPESWRSAQFGKEQCYLAGCRISRIRTMYKVLREQRPEVAANRARSGFGWVRGTHQVPNHGPGVLGAFQHQSNGWRTANELDESIVERLACMFDIVPASQIGIDGQHAHGNDRQAFGFETTDDFADEAAFDGIRFTENKGAIHMG